MELNKGTYIKAGLAVTALSVTYVLAAVVVPRTMVTFTKAAPASKVSISDSRVLGQKILCRADGEDRCIVNVFILDKSSKGVQGKQVVLNGEADISPTIAATDENGKASFTITSKTEKQVSLTASVGGMDLGSEIKVTFRN